LRIIDARCMIHNELRNSDPIAVGAVKATDDDSSSGT